MKLATGISLIAGIALILLYSILVGVMVPGWKGSNGNLLDVLKIGAIAYVGSSGGSPILLPNTTAQGWSLVTVKQVHLVGNTTSALHVVLAIPNSDFYNPIEQAVVVASCSGLAVLFVLVLSLALIVHFCVNKQLAAKKTGTTDIPYTIFNELK